jgi:hypothetical protein
MIQASFVKIFFLAAGLAHAVGDGVCTTNDCVADASSESQADVETMEEQESAALRVELLQSGVLRQRGQVITSTIAEVPALQAANATNAANRTMDTDATNAAAVAETESANTEGEEADLIALDHEGNVCMLCGKPMPERTDKQYTEFRKDCGHLSSSTGPNATILALPAAEIVRRANSEGRDGNGFCELNFAKSCADAVANKDYLYWPKSMNMNTTKARANAAWDARYCRQNGFLEKDIVMLQHDFEGMRAKGKELCKTKYSKYDIEKLSFMDMMTNARYDDEAAPTLSEAELLAAWNCAMGDLGCDLALCAYSFCSHGDGKGEGLYSECEGWPPCRACQFPEQQLHWRRSQ